MSSKKLGLEHSFHYLRKREGEKELEEEKRKA